MGVNDFGHPGGKTEWAPEEAGQDPAGKNYHVRNLKPESFREFYKKEVEKANGLVDEFFGKKEKEEE